MGLWYRVIEVPHWQAQHPELGWHHHPHPLTHHSHSQDLLKRKMLQQYFSILKY